MSFAEIINRAHMGNFRLLKVCIFTFFMVMITLGVSAQAPVTAPKAGSPTAKDVTKDDLLGPKSKISPERVYPKEDLNIGPAFLEDIQSTLDFSIKPYGKIGYPIFPSLEFMTDAGMDIFSGLLYYGGGVQFPSFLGSSVGTIQLEGFVNGFKSGEGAGLSSISDGILVGTTTFNGFGGYISHNFYPFSFDYLYFGIGGGIFKYKYTVEYIEKDIFIDLTSKTLTNVEYSGMAPLAVASIGADIPLYKNIRAQFGVDYHMLFFSGKLGSYMLFNTSIAFLF